MDYSHLDFAELTDTGRCRSHNEDAVLCLGEAGVFALADGMGGAFGGELASQLTVTTLRKALRGAGESFSRGPLAARVRSVAAAINEASKSIKEEADNVGAVGTGTTVVLLVFDPMDARRAVALHAGDSRLYRFRTAELTCLTVDHSIAAEMGLDDSEGLPPMFRGVITRAVGLTETTLLSRTPVDVSPNDLFLLCSDGLSKMLPEAALCRLLEGARERELSVTTKQLVDAANEAGGEDNISVVLVQTASELPEAETVVDEGLGDTIPSLDIAELTRDEAERDSDDGQAEPGNSTPQSSSESLGFGTPRHLVGDTPTPGADSSEQNAITGEEPPQREA